MKNNVIIDFDTTRNPALILGKFNKLPMNTEGQPVTVADLDTTLNAVVTQIRVLESMGANLDHLLKSVIKAIEKGVFQADLDVRINNVSINARKD